MKLRIFFALLTVLLSLTATFSFGANNDLNIKLAQEKQYFIDRIQTQKGSDLINTADFLSRTGITDQAVYDAVESKLINQFEYVKANLDDKDAQEELNSLQRALASMSPKSHPLLQQIFRARIGKGVGHRSVSLIKKLSWYQTRNEIMQKPDSYQPGQELMTYRFLNLLDANDPTFRRWATEEINRSGHAEPVIFEKLRTIIAAEKYDIKNDLHLDFLAWACKILVIYDKDNSKQLLDSILNDTSNNLTIKKLQRYAKPI